MIFDNLIELELSAAIETEMSLVHIAGYVTLIDPELRESIIWANYLPLSQSGKFTDCFEWKEPAIFRLYYMKHDQKQSFYEISMQYSRASSGILYFSM